LLVPGDFPEELMKGVIERGEEQHREIAEAELRDERRGKRERKTKSRPKKKGNGA